jgi:hypothetical protein
VMKLGEKTINDIKEIFAVSFTWFSEYVLYILICLKFHRLSGFRQQN